MLGIHPQTIYTAQGFIAAAVSGALALYLLPRQHTPSTRALIGLVLSVAFWSFSYAMELQADDLAGKLDWVRTEYLGAAWVGPLFFRFAMVISAKHDWISGPRNWVLMGVPVVTLVMVYTNDQHHLMWLHAWIETDGPLPTLAFHRGIGFWCFVGVSYTLLMVASLVLFHTFLAAGKLERINFWVLMVGLTAPWGCNFLYLLRINPFQYIDFTPLAFSISGFTFFWVVVRHQILELIPIARDAVIASLADAVLVLNLQGRVVDLNTSAGKLLPERSTGHIGKPLANLLPKLWRLIDKPDNPGIDGTEIILPASGRDRRWRITHAWLYSSGKIPCGWLITLHDITEQRRNEIALRESEAKFRSISANALDGIIMIDPKGYISFWNRAAEKIFGYHADAVIGRGLHDTLAPKHFHERYRKAFAKFQQTGTGTLLGKTIEIECVHQDGHLFPAELSLSPMQLNDQWHAVGIIRDITERKKTQDYLIQSEKMLSVGGLAAGMAHEINNPLSGILSNIQMVRMRLTEPLPANLDAAAESGLDLENLKAYITRRGILEMVTATEQSCKRAADIVRNMLDFSRKSDTVFTPHNLVRLMAQTVALADNDFRLKNQFDFRRIEIVTEYAPDVPAVHCDGSQIQQVLLNILKNGAQAMWEVDGSDRSPRFILRVYSAPPFACIAISDNGPGISEAVRKRIFEPFYTTKPIGAGTGLGLSIAYFIVVERHGGMLEVEAAPGEGTTFIVKLPIEREEDDGVP